MWKFVGPALYTLLLCATGRASISPDRTAVNFANTINQRIVDSTYDEPVLYFGNVWHPYDRDLPPEGGFLCEGNEGTVAVDETVQEAYKYSCCEGTRCPIPPPEPPDILRSLLFERPVELWGWSRNTTWKKLPQTFTYYDEHSAVGYAKRFLAVAVAATFVLGVLSVVASLLHQGTNRFPGLCLVVHIFTLVSLGIVNDEAFREVGADPSVRGQMIRAGLVHTYVIMIMSPVIIYTPANAEDGDQRIRSKCGETLTAYAHSKAARRFASVVCLLHAVVGDALGSYALMDSVWSILDAEFEVLVGVALCYAVGTTIHVIAFFTAIHEIEVPLRLDDPQSIHNVRKKAHVNIQRHIVGFHDDDGVLRPKPGWRGEPFHVYAAKPCSLGITLQVWDVGEVSRGEINFVHNNKRETRCTGSLTIVKLDGHRNEDLEVYVCNKTRDLERIGTIDSEHVFHYDLSMVASLIKSFFHLVPQQDDDEYALNVVHNQREWMHRKQRACGLSCCGQPLYGVVWWVALVSASVASLSIVLYHVELLLLPFYLVEILSVAGLFLFGAVVGLVEEDVKAIAPASTGLKMRNGKFTCYSGHVCMETKSAIGWVDDMTQESLDMDTPVYYCYKCDFVTAK